MNRSTKRSFAPAFGVLLVTALCATLHADAPPTPENPNVWPTAITFNWDPTGPFNSTMYWLQITDDPTYTTYFGNFITQYSSWTLTGLTPGTTYYARVAANYSLPNQTVFADLPSTTTPAVGLPGPAVVNPVISGETYNSISVNWTSPFSTPVSNKGLGSRQYTVEASTASNFSGSITSGLTLSNSTTISGLGIAAGTTYYVRVGALYPTGNGTTGTVNYAPTTPTYVLTDSTDVVTGLTAYQVGSTSITWTWNPVPDATAYNVYQASSPTTLVANVAQSSFTETGLSINTLYGRVVAAVIGGTDHALCHATSSYTLTPPPGAPTFTDVAFTSATVSWSANGNTDGTTYEYTLALSYGYGGMVYTTTSTSTLLSGLAEGCSFYLSVASLNSAGVRTHSSISTLLTPGNFVPQNFTASATGITSGIWSWDAPRGASSYALYPDSSTATPSETTSGQSYSKVGLSPNTTYARYLRAYFNGIFSDLTGPTTIYTWAATPGQPTFSNVSYTSATLTWSAQSNSGGTPYEISQSTISDFSSAVSTPIAFAANFTGTTTTFINLVNGTPYYFRVRAENSQNIVTGFSTAGSTTTLVTPATTLLSGTAQGGSSITWTWSNVAGATFKLYDSGTSTLIAGGIASTSYTEINLSTNTSYSRKVTAVLYGESAFSNIVSTCTLASSPTSANPTNVQASQFMAHWGANGNPSGTSYLVVASADSGFSTIAASSNTTATSAVITGLQADTTYYVEVQAINLNGISTAFVALPSTQTLPNPPTAPTPAGSALGTSSIAWSWNSVSGATGYRVVSSIGGNLSGDLGSSATFFVQVGLSTNTAYAASVAAFNAGGTSTSTLLAKYTLALAPTGSSITDVGGSSITLSWPNPGNPAGTTYSARLWQTGASTTTFNGTGNSAVFTGLVNSTTYYLSVVTINGDGISTTADVTLSTVTLPKTTTSVDPSAGQTIVYSGPDGPITLVIPPGSFPETVTVSIQEPSSYPQATANVGDFQATGVGIQINLDSPNEPTKVAMLSIPFSDVAMAGLDKNTLVIARYDSTRNIWIPYVSTVDPGQNLVTAHIDHFSLYQIMSAVAPPALNDVKIYPNPFRPSLGHTSITISNLPANSRARIYTIAGELVKDLTANAAGMISWNATNRSGQQVASGLYFVLVQGAGDKNRLRVVIQR